MALRSISMRLTLWFSAVFFGGLVLFGAVMWYNLKDTLTTGRSRTLDRRAERLADLLQSVDEEPAMVRARKFQAFAEATGGGLIEVFRADGTRALPSPTAVALAFPWPSMDKLDRDRFSEIQFQGQPYRILARPFLLGPQKLVLLVAAPLENNRHVLQTFSAGLLWTIPVLLCLSALGGYLLSRRALQPVDRITMATRSISLSNLSGRLPVPDTRDELQRLSETCNEMLGRLESAVNEIKRFTGDASHELRNPVAFVRTTAELALRNPDTDRASRAAFEQIVAECGKANRLLKDMLTLARADAGDSRLAFEVVDLSDAVGSVYQRARLLAQEAGHTLTVSFDGVANATVWGDYSALQRLFWILLDNAMKYTPPPGRIEVRVTSFTSAATVRVADNGIGISSGDLPHIFRRFYRADPSRSQVEGSGLGLAIASWIAEIHHATLTAESDGSRGSVFTLAIPLLSARPVETLKTAGPDLASDWLLDNPVQ